MKTISSVHTPEERLEMRQLGEGQALRSQWRLLACVSILRTAITRVLPLAGAAGWWITLVCLVPGMILHTLGCWQMKRGGSISRFTYVLVALGLAADSISTLTALITLFTQGIGAAGTQFTLALVAGGMLLFALNREGLARGIYFLRLPLWLFVAAVCMGYVSRGRLDHVFPVLGDGMSSMGAALRAGVGMGWVFALPLLEQPVKERKYAETLPVVLLCGVVLLALTLYLPHEQLISHYALGDCLVQTVQLGALLRLLAICLWMGTLFLSVGSGCSMAAANALAPWGRRFAWLPGVLAALLVLTQLLPLRDLWKLMAQVEPWLLAVPAFGVVTIRRKRK